MWPVWNKSKAPSMYTIVAPGGGTRPLLNCTMRREVGMKLRVGGGVEEGKVG